MAFYCCAACCAMAFELAAENRVYADMASKFFEHYIDDRRSDEHAGRHRTVGRKGRILLRPPALWSDKPFRCGSVSMVGIIPLFTVEVMLDEVIIDQLPGFRNAMEWFLDNQRFVRPHVLHGSRSRPHGGGRSPDGDSIRRPFAANLCGTMLDEDEFLSPFGIRSLSKVHEQRAICL